MSKKFFGLLGVLVLLLISTNVMAQEEEPTLPDATEQAVESTGYPLAMADRPLVLDTGMGEAGLDVNIGLNKDQVAKNISLTSANISDRYEGLSFAYGVMENLEAGVAINALYYQGEVKTAGVVTTESATKFGGAYLYGKYAFMPMVGAELGIFVPGWGKYVDKFGDQLLGVKLGVPFQFIAMPGMLKIHARPDFIVSFAKKEAVGQDTMPMAIYFDAGATFNATPELFFDLSFGLKYTLKPNKVTATVNGVTAEADIDSALLMDIPISLTAGYTVMPEMDIYLAFQIADVAADKDKGEGEMFDTKSIGLGANFRF